MGAASFQQNQVLTMQGTVFTMLRKIDPHLWQLEERSTKRIIERSDTELRSAYVKHEIVFHNDNLPLTKLGATYRDVSTEKMELAKIRRMYAEAIIDYPGNAVMISPIVDRIWAKANAPIKKPSVRSVLRWKSDYVKSGRDILSLVTRDENKGNRSSRFDEEVEKIIEIAIDEIYMNRNKRTVKATTNRAIVLVDQENSRRPSSMKLPMPTVRLVQRLINQMPAMERSICRDGQTVANKKFRSMMKHRITKVPLERAEIDHTLLDIFVVDEKRALPLGRPWLTVCIDHHSRCILGIHISFEPPSCVTVAKCLRHAFLPKTDLKEKYPRINNDWEAHGIMQELSVDNGAEFHSEALDRACLTLGIGLHYSPRKTPWHKGAVERFFGTLESDLIHSIPGTTFSNIFQKDDYDPKKTAVVTLNTLRYVINKWVVDYYHQMPHRKLQAKPADIWRSRISIDDIMVPDNPDYLDAILGKIELRVLTHKGIEYQGLFYNSPELTKLRYELGEKLKVEVSVDNSDLGKVVAFSPDKKRMFIVPAVDLEYATDLTLWQHKVIKRYAKEFLDGQNPMDWLNARDDIREMIEEEMSLTKTKKGRKAIARFTGEKNSKKQKTPSETENSIENVPAATATAIPIQFPTPVKKVFKVEQRNRIDHDTFTNNKGNEQ